MGLPLACVVKILHDYWSIRLGENRPYRALKHLAAMLSPGLLARKISLLSLGEIQPLTSVVFNSLSSLLCFLEKAVEFSFASELYDDRN